MDSNTDQPAGHGHVYSILSAADQNRREAKALTEAAQEAPPGAAAEVYKLKHALIEAFRHTFVMDTRHVKRISEQIAADLYRQGVMVCPGRAPDSNKSIEDTGKIA